MSSRLVRYYCNTLVNWPKPAKEYFKWWLLSLLVKLPLRRSDKYFLLCRWPEIGFDYHGRGPSWGHPWQDKRKWEYVDTTAEMNEYYAAQRTSATRP